MAQQSFLVGGVSKSDDGATVEVQDKTKAYTLSVYFDVIEEHSISLQSQITDNWMENNSVVSDHIANQPITVTLRGLSGEVVYIPSTSEGWLNDLNNKIPLSVAQTFNKLSPVAALIPPVSNLTQIAKNALTYVESSFKRYKKIIDNFKNPQLKQTRLRKIYQELSEIREGKLPLLVQTPYVALDNMYIQSLVLRQGNQNFITDIELTLKQVYFSETQTTTVNKENREKCNFVQREDVENHGITQGKDIGANGSGGNSDEGDSYNLLFKIRITND